MNRGREELPGMWPRAGPPAGSCTPELQSQGAAKPGLELAEATVHLQAGAEPLPAAQHLGETLPWGPCP